MNNSNTIILFEYFQVKIELLEFTEMHIDFMYIADFLYLICLVIYIKKRSKCSSIMPDKCFQFVTLQNTINLKWTMWRI